MVEYHLIAKNIHEFHLYIYRNRAPEKPFFSPGVKPINPRQESMIFVAEVKS